MMAYYLDPAIKSRDDRMAVQQVVAGIIQNDAGEVLIARRRIDQDLPGLWEFPGGKCKPSESAEQALARELYEELGVTASQITPFRSLAYSYPNKKVALHFFHVNQIDGEPYGREGQQVRWCAIDQLKAAEFPPANRDVIKALQLPELYGISQMQSLGMQLFEQKLISALENGLRLMQFREPEMPEQEFKLCARHFASLCHRYGARFLINAPVDWLPDCDADGVHLSVRAAMSCRSRPVPEDKWLGVSCHNAEEIRHAERINADFIVLSPVKRTASHLGARPMGWSTFEQLCHVSPLPVYALGGLQQHDLKQAQQLGAQGVAMIRGLWN